MKRLQPNSPPFVIDSGRLLTQAVTSGLESTKELEFTTTLLRVRLAEVVRFAGYYVDYLIGGEPEFKPPDPSRTSGRPETPDGRDEEMNEWRDYYAASARTHQYLGGARAPGCASRLRSLAGTGGHGFAISGEPRACHSRDQR